MTYKKKRGRYGVVRIRPAVIIVLLLALAAFGVYNIGRSAYIRVFYPIKYQQLILTEAKNNGLDPAFVFAVVKTESSFRPDAVSSVGARGLMQLTSDAFDWVRFRMGEDQSGLTFEDMFDPEVNVRYGTYMLRLLLDEFGSERNALAAYHAGWGSVKRWLDDPRTSIDGREIDNIPYGDTSWYVDKVLKTRLVYEKHYPKIMNG